MPYSPLPDLDRPATADFAALDAVEAAAAALREGHLRMLARTAEVGMELIEAISRKANDDSAGASDIGVAYAKVSQALRRTIALHERLAQDRGAGAAQRRDERERRCADEAEAHKDVKDQTILCALEDALASSCPEEAREAGLGETHRLLGDVQASLDLQDENELRGYLDRPVGETVARLCAALGLDPEACKLEDGAWRVRRPPSAFERTCAQRRGQTNAPLSTGPP